MYLIYFVVAAIYDDVVQCGRVNGISLFGLYIYIYTTILYSEIKEL